MTKHTTIDSPKRDDPTIDTQSSGMLLLDPNISQIKGRKREGRLKSGIELSQNKKKRFCALRDKSGHDKRICPLNPKRKKIE